LVCNPRSDPECQPKTYSCTRISA